jgi:hypothetical protein
MVCFLRIAVRPIAIIIKSGPWNRKNAPHWSFAFQGRNGHNERWVTLTERNDELRPCSHWKGYVLDAPKAFTEFRLLYTGRVVPGVPNFSISGLEIHGAVFPQQCEEEEPTEQHICPQENLEEFDPWSISECE